MFQVSRTTVAGRSGFSALHTTNQPKYLSAALLILIYNRKSLPHRRAILYSVHCTLQCTWYCTARGRNPPVQHNAEPVYCRKMWENTAQATLLRVRLGTGSHLRCMSNFAFKYLHEIEFTYKVFYLSRGFRVLIF